MVLASLMFCSSVTWPLGNPSKLKQHYGTSIFRKPSLTRCQAKRSCDCYDMCKELIPYAKAWSWQKAIVDRRKEQIERNEDLADTLIILQHQPVYTLGTGSTEGNLHFDIKNPPFELYRTERGGEVTYHGPGQLVMYPIINLRYHKMDLHWYLRSLEEVIIRVLSSSFSMEASRIDGLTGVWVDDTTCNPSKYLSGKCGGTTRFGALVGGIVAGATLMVSVGLTCCFIRRRLKFKDRRRRSRELCETTGISIPVYPCKEMEKATNFFSEKRRLGNGAYGTVYSGKLQNDNWVAIKRIRNRDTDSIEQVINEIKLLSSVNHLNLVRLLGCSIEKGGQILVYEFMPNGTLSQHLQREKGNGLPWPIRLTIAAETAQAIAYLHKAMHPPIYHRDVKSSDILLDYNYKSKVADFGLSRLGMIESSHISTAPQGTPGYLDPQYHQNFQLSDKSDVYSFGLVLAEIITGLKAVDFARPQDEMNLAALAIDRIGKGCLDEVIDPFIESHIDAWTLSSIHKVAELAFRCLAFHRDMRPSMMEVAIELEQLRLSRWAISEDIITASSEGSSISSSSDVSEKPLNLSIKKQNLDIKAILLADKVRDFSPVSVRDPWQSEQSSPSNCSSLLNHIVK